MVNERLINLNLDWISVAVIAMVIFGVVGFRNGWRRGLVTLVSLFFAWGLALKSVDFLIGAVEYATGLDYSGPLRGFFQLLLYLAAVVMTVVTFNSRIIDARIEDRRDQLSGLSTGLLGGYFFVILLLDLGREWLATHVEDWELVYNSTISLSERATQTILIATFRNNPFVAYERLAQAQNLILLFLLVVFWHGLIWSLLGRVDRKLRPAPPPRQRVDG